MFLVGLCLRMDVDFMDWLDVVGVFKIDSVRELFKDYNSCWVVVCFVCCRSKIKCEKGCMLNDECC